MQVAVSDVLNAAQTEGREIEAPAARLCPIADWAIFSISDPIACRQVAKPSWHRNAFLLVKRPNTLLQSGLPIWSRFVPTLPLLFPARVDPTTAVLCDLDRRSPWAFRNQEDRVPVGPSTVPNGLVTLDPEGPRRDPSAPHCALRSYHAYSRASGGASSCQR